MVPFKTFTSNSKDGVLVAIPLYGFQIFIHRYPSSERLRIMPRRLMTRKLVLKSSLADKAISDRTF